MEIVIIILSVIIAWLIIAILVMFDRIENSDREKSFYQDLYHQYKDESDDIHKKLYEYDKIFENIKSLIPF